MTTTELAAAVNQRGNYHKGDGSPVDDFQVHGRTRNYRAVFETEGSRVRLIGTDERWHLQPGDTTRGPISTTGMAAKSGRRLRLQVGGEVA